MLPRKYFSRIDTVELKALIVRKIGRKKADRYFDQLKRLFTLKLGKCEFEKLCVRTIGRENLSLHNRLILSIIQNACLAQVPPFRARKQDSAHNVKIANGYRRNCLQSLYGDAFPPSPRKCRTMVNRDRKFQDRPSPLGPLGKSHSVMCEVVTSKTLELQSPTELLSLGSRPPIEVASVEDGEEVEQGAGSPGVQSRSPVRAPLGISMNTGEARKTFCSGSMYNFRSETCYMSGGLPDTRSLRSCLEEKLQKEGVNISVDCTNLLNYSLDAYLKRLIEPCMVGSSRGIQCLKQPDGLITNALNGTLPRRCIQMPNKSNCASMLDFRIAMELNPQVLGVDWPTQLEKICFRASEE